LTSKGRSGGSVSGYTIAYTYDNAGNRATKTLNSATENYAYDNAGKLTSAGGKTYTYDNAGNVKTVASTAGTTTLSWDADSRLTGIAYPNSTSNTFTYNGLAQRVGTTDSRGTLAYTLEDDSVDSAVLKDSAATYTHGLGLVSEVRGGASKFYHPDALGTTRAMTGSTGSVTDTKSTDAFGNTFTAGSSGTTPTPFGFAGQHGYQSDPDSGLMRLGCKTDNSCSDARNGKGSRHGTETGSRPSLVSGQSLCFLLKPAYPRWAFPILFSCMITGFIWSGSD